LAKRTEYFVDNLWPKRRFNLIFGPSGAGKTYWLMPQIYALMDGKPIQGISTKPTKVAYACCDRTVEDAEETILNLGLDPTRLPMFSFMDNDLPLGIQSLTNWVPAGTELLIVEAIAGLLPGNNQNKISDYGAVMTFGRAINRLMRSIGLGCWGTTHSPKIKKDELFLHNRDNALGSALWGGISGTMVEVQYDEKTQQRLIRTMPRHAEPYTDYYEFNEKHQLVPVVQGTANALLGRWLDLLEPKTEITTNMVYDKAAHFRLSESTAKRWIRDMEEEGRLFRIQNGLYLVRAKQ